MLFFREGSSFTLRKPSVFLSLTMVWTHNRNAMGRSPSMTSKARRHRLSVPEESEHLPFKRDDTSGDGGVCNSQLPLSLEVHLLTNSDDVVPLPEQVWERCAEQLHTQTSSTLVAHVHAKRVSVTVLLFHKILEAHHVAIGKHFVEGVPQSSPGSLWRSKRPSSFCDGEVTFQSPSRKTTAS